MDLGLSMHISVSMNEHFAPNIFCFCCMSDSWRKFILCGWKYRHEYDCSETYMYSKQEYRIKFFVCVSRRQTDFFIENKAESFIPIRIKVCQWNFSQLSRFEVKFI